MRGKNLRTGKLTIVDIPDMGKQFELPIATTSGEKFEIRIQMVSADFGILLAEWSKEVRAGKYITTSKAWKNVQKRLSLSSNSRKLNFLPVVLNFEENSSFEFAPNK